MIILIRRRKGERHSEEERLEFRTLGEAKAAAFGYKHVSLRCDSCEMVTINGVACHETGCPDAWKDEQRFCDFCDSMFKPETKGQQFCCDSCADSFHGVAREAQDDYRDF